MVLEILKISFFGLIKNGACTEGGRMNSSTFQAVVVVFHPGLTSPFIPHPSSLIPHPSSQTNALLVSEVG